MIDGPVHMRRTVARLWQRCRGSIAAEGAEVAAVNATVAAAADHLEIGSCLPTLAPVIEMVDMQPVGRAAALAAMAGFVQLQFAPLPPWAAVVVVL